MLQLARVTSKYQGRFWRFCLVGFSGALIQIGLTRLLFFLFTHYLFIDGTLANTLSVVIVIPITTVWNFIWNVFWVFKARKTHET